MNGLGRSDQRSDNNNGSHSFGSEEPSPRSQGSYPEDSQGQVVLETAPDYGPASPAPCQSQPTQRGRSV